MIKTISLIVISLVIQSETARILAFFPSPSISHQVPFRPLTQELARRGHEVVAITTNPAFPKGKSPANLTEINIQNLSYSIWTKSFISSDKTQGSSNNWISQAELLFNVLIDVFGAQLQDEEVVKVLDKSNKYDLMITEAFMVGTLALSHLHKVPMIQVSSFGAMTYNLETMGSFMHMFLHPAPTQQRVVNLTMWDKIYELYVYYRLKYIFISIEEKTNKLLKRIFGPEIPDISELKNNVDMMFLNVNSLWELNRPVPPNVIYMWGIHQKPQKELPQVRPLIIIFEVT
jgi:glucuronosyltransferase